MAYIKNKSFLNIFSIVIGLLTLFVSCLIFENNCRVEKQIDTLHNFNYKEIVYTEDYIENEKKYGFLEKVVIISEKGKVSCEVYTIINDDLLYKKEIKQNEIVLSLNLKEKLGLKTGDFISFFNIQNGNYDKLIVSDFFEYNYGFYNTDINDNCGVVLINDSISSLFGKKIYSYFIGGNNFKLPFNIDKRIIKENIMDNYYKDIVKKSINYLGIILIIDFITVIAMNKIMKKNYIQFIKNYFNKLNVIMIIFKHRNIDICLSMFCILFLSFYFYSSINLILTLLFIVVIELIIYIFSCILYCRNKLNFGG